MDSFFDKLPEYIEYVIANASPFIIVAVIIALVIAYRKTQGETKKAVKTADMLGLTYINVAEEMKKSHSKDAAVLGLLSNWSTWAMEGIFNKAAVRVELIVKGKQNRYIEFNDRVSMSNPTTTSYSRGVEYVVSFEKKLPFMVTIFQNIKMGFGMTLNTAKKIDTGDETLDQMLFISGEDKKSIQEWLKPDHRKDALKKLINALPMVCINSGGLYYRDSKTKPDYQRIKNNLTLLSEAVQDLESN